MQVGPEKFSPGVSNGAMARVLRPGEHRLRRGQGKHSESQFMQKLRELRTARSDWEQVRIGLTQLAQKRLLRDDVAHVIRSLRQSPFFLSSAAASAWRGNRVVMPEI